MISTVVRRLLLTAAPLGLAAAAVLLTAGSASADTPEGWPEEEAVDLVEVLLLFGGIPVLVFLVILAFILGPPLARGESVRPGGAQLETQWLGGPRKAAGELAAPDSDDSKAGGAGGSW